MGFEDLFAEQQKQSPIDAILAMLDTTDIDNKTVLEMPHIKFICMNTRLHLRKEFPNMSPTEVDQQILLLYRKLKVSYKGLSWGKVIEGIKEMKPQLMEANIKEGLRR